MKKIIYSCLIALLYIDNLNAQDTIRWSDDTIFVKKDISIDTGKVLLIESGTRIIFMSNYTIKIYGMINCKGSRDDSIYFQINDTTSLMDTSTLNGGWGGIKLLTNNSDSSFFNYCNFYYGKTLDSGGALYAYNYNKITIKNSVFQHNVAAYSGAAIYFYQVNNSLISNCFFKYNQSLQNKNTDFYGGAIAAEESKITIDSNIFFKNVALEIHYSGGTVCYCGVGAAVYTSFCPAGYPVIINNVFSNNTGVSGTLYENNIKAYIANNLLINNKDIAFMNGHGGSQTLFINNTIANNFTDFIPYSSCDINSKYYRFINNIVWNNPSAAYPAFPQIGHIPGRTEISYSCIQYSYPGEGNISDPPVFTNPTQGAGVYFNGLEADWTLQNSSYCIDAGIPDTSGLNIPPLDLAHNNRTVNGRIDMGAYENQTVSNKIIPNAKQDKPEKKEIDNVKKSELVDLRIIVKKSYHSQNKNETIILEYKTKNNETVLPSLSWKKHINNEK